MKKTLKTYLLHIEVEDYDLFALSNEDDDEMLNIKRRFHNLQQYEKNLFLLYIKEDCNVNSLARYFNIRWSTMNHYIKKIRTKLCK